MTRKRTETDQTFELNANIKKQVVNTLTSIGKNPKKYWITIVEHGGICKFSFFDPDIRRIHICHHEKIPDVDFSIHHEIGHAQDEILLHRNYNQWNQTKIYLGRLCWILFVVVFLEDQRLQIFISSIVLKNIYNNKSIIYAFIKQSAFYKEKYEKSLNSLTDMLWITEHVIIVEWISLNLITLYLYESIWTFPLAVMFLYISYRGIYFTYRCLMFEVSANNFAIEQLVSKNKCQPIEEYIKSINNVWLNFDTCQKICQLFRDGHCVPYEVYKMQQFNKSKNNKK